MQQRQTLPFIADFLHPYLAREAEEGRLRPGVELDRAAEYLARCILSLINAPGRWDLDDPEQVHDLVRGALLGGIVYAYFRVDIRPDLERAGHWPALGLFDLKEHFVAIGFALLPAYWVCWRQPRADEPPQTRVALTSLLAFIVWWSFLIGHVLNNLRGFGS